ncbi:MAG: heavy-metal-associated domain-containing protein [Acidimicrobiia bacterium]
MTTVILSVPDISCDHCKRSIEGAVAPLEGVASAEVSIGDRTVAVVFDADKVTVADIIEAIDTQGYEVADA